MIPYQFPMVESQAHYLNRFIPMTWWTILILIFRLSDRELLIAGTTLFVMTWFTLLETVFENRKVKTND